MKKFILHSKNVSRDSYIWNMIGSLFLAFQSVLILMVLTRVIGLVQAGIFTIAYANANLFMNIGKYGIRNFQVSDSKEQFTFGDYLKCRYITFFIAVIVSVLYAVYNALANGYSAEKTWIIIIMCIYKFADVIEDVYGGRYQQKGRLDVAAKTMALRTIISVFVLIASVCITKNQLLSLAITTLITYVQMIVFIIWTRQMFVLKDDYQTDLRRRVLLLKTCFPLFLGSFLSLYIGNAPKYAIDAQLSDEIQACYGFIAMPVFVIGLINNFIFNPLIYSMSELWRKKKYRDFFIRILRQIMIVFFITFVCIVGAYFMGVPVLSLLYNTDLRAYKTELLILLIGGGFLALSGFFSTIITIMRLQKHLTWSYGMIALIALSASDFTVKNYSVYGAAILYTALMLGLCICFAIIIIYGILQRTVFMNKK